MRSTFNYRKPSVKQMIRDLKDLATGRTTIESLAKTMLPDRNIVVYETEKGITIEGCKEPMTKEQYEIWLEAERQKGPIRQVLHFTSFGNGNEPLIHHSEETFAGGVNWKQTLTYSTGTKEDVPVNELQTDTDINTIDPVQHTAKKEQPVKRFKQPPVKKVIRQEKVERLISLKEHEEFNKAIFNKIFR